MKAWRSSAVKSVFSLRIGLLTTPTTTRSKARGAAGDDVEVAVGHRVVAARDRPPCRRAAPSARPLRRRRRRRRRSGAGAGAAASRSAAVALRRSRRSPARPDREGAADGCPVPAPRGRRVYRGHRRRRGRSRGALRPRAGRPASARRRRGPARPARRGRAARRCRAPARVSRSTRVARAAPRESASIARAPVPQ